MDFRSAHAHPEGGKLIEHGFEASPGHRQEVVTAAPRWKETSPRKSTKNRLATTL